VNVYYVVSKLVRGIVTLLLAVTFVFVLLRVAGDPATVLLSDNPPPGAVEAYRKLWGLDKPIPEQFVRYIWGALHGEFGFSFRDGRPALAIVLERIPATLTLGLTALLVALLIGIPAGVFAALNRGSAIDRVTMSFTVLGHSMPNFFLGILLIILFSLWLQWLPSSGNSSWKHLIMPALTLGTGAAGAIARFTRASMLDVLSQPYIRTARAKGIELRSRILFHALPNASIPIVTVVGLRVGALIGGAVVTEPVFGWPGIGLLLVGSVGQRDLAVVQVIVLFIAFTMVVVNLSVDFLYRLIDPRVRAADARKG
jgi:peptide/nickel transport system permease protein